MKTETAPAEITMSVGRDYRLSSGYEYVIFEGEDVILRAGCFKTAATARRAGVKAAQALLDARDA